MIDVRQGGPGEIEVRIDDEPGVVTGDCEINPSGVGADTWVLWIGPTQALDLANKLMDIVQAIDDAKREV